MVKYIILIATFSFLQACKKENKKTCYECNTGGLDLKEVGCFTEKEWADTTIRTLDGREIDKSTCREK
jgi:hypothetical protein